MQTGPHRDPPPCQAVSQLLAIDPAVAEGQNSGLTVRRRRGEDLDPLYPFQRGGHAADQMLLMAANPGDPLSPHEAQPLGQSRDPRHILRPGFQTIRQKFRHGL